MTNVLAELSIDDAAEFVPGRLWYAALKKVPSRTSGTVFFSIDEELIYWNFCLDFGPLNLGHTFVFSDMLNKKLAAAAKSGDKVVFYSSTQGQQRANAVCILCCWGMLYQGMSATKAFEPFQRMRFPPFHDATPGVCTFALTILDCLKGLEKAMQAGYISAKTFDLHEFQHFERVENGDLTWISPKLIAFAGPHNFYSRSPQGHVMLTPEHYIPYFKKRNVTLVVRLNDKQYDENKFLSAGIDHLDLIYPDGTNAPFPILLQFLDACEKTPGTVAVHCKAGLGRTGTCIGAYMMKHDLFSAHELIGYLRLCRPGSVIGPQQQFLESIEARIWQLNTTRATATATASAPARPGSSSVSKLEHRDRARMDFALPRTPSGSIMGTASSMSPSPSSPMVKRGQSVLAPLELKLAPLELRPSTSSLASIVPLSSPTGRGSSSALAMATTTTTMAMAATGRMDPSQGDKLNDQKYMRYTRNLTGVFW